MKHAGEEYHPDFERTDMNRSPKHRYQSSFSHLIRMILQQHKKVTSSGALPDDHWIKRESNAYPSELT